MPRAQDAPCVARPLAVPALALPARPALAGPRAIAGLLVREWARTLGARSARIQPPPAGGLRGKLRGGGGVGSCPSTGSLRERAGRGGRSAASACAVCAAVGSSKCAHAACGRSRASHQQRQAEHLRDGAGIAVDPTGHEIYVTEAVTDQVDVLTSGPAPARPETLVATEVKGKSAILRGGLSPHSPAEKLESFPTLPAEFSE